ncbi:hypothetical protein GTP58_24430 [Duganella sp. CY15W]|uniref:phage tail tube protein n=1 Tax=Duganella sp. CY15W TaxID=2692172 RepID=UPI00136C4529|nr:phage tail tube protein [Duganella sp. CY15W]MYM31485.1 hypothetical protein [Duganella sp. CY15W]
MGTASGIYKQVAYKEEVVYGVIPAAGAAQAVRRVTSSLDMTKDTYQSNESRTDFQLADFRHGARKVAGSINGELSAKTYADFMAAALKKPFAATAPIVGASITIAGVDGAYTITRAAGSFLTDGVKVGDVVRLTAGALNVANINKNVLVTDATALVLTGLVLNATPLVAEGPIAASTVTVVGKKTMIPQSGHTDKSFSIEHWYPDVPANEVYSGCKVSKIGLSLPPTGMATCTIEFMGKDALPGAAQYFVAPNPVTTTGTMAAVNGVLRVGNATVANVTGLSIDIASAQSGDPTVGSNTVAFMAAGRVLVTGQMTATFNSTALRDAFYNETEISLYAVFTADNSAAADFVAFSIGRLKVSGASKDDGEKTITQTIPFQALLNVAGGAVKATDLTTIAIQDSAV